jgi:hypothetical protein
MAEVEVNKVQPVALSLYWREYYFLMEMVKNNKKINNQILKI